MSRDHHDARERRDVHSLDEHGMVLCNPRDREAAHRAETGAIAVAATPADVTCVRCRKALAAA